MRTLVVDDHDDEEELVDKPRKRRRASDTSFADLKKEHLPTASLLGGGAYTGRFQINKEYRLTVEHVVPQHWCGVTKLVFELRNVTHDAHLITIVTTKENASRGTKPRSFVNLRSRANVASQRTA